VRARKARASLTMAVRSIVVVGAGIAGLACALACARAGARVDVFEARAQPATIPAHLDVVPNLLRDFARLGVAEACVRRGFAYHGLAVVDERGQPGFEIATPRLAGSHLPCAVGIAYADALDLLKSHAQSAGAVLHAGRRVASVHAESGHVATAEGGQVQADLVVLATGAQSSLVAQLFGALPARAEAELSWWHALLPRPEGLERSTWMAGAAGRRLLLVPIDMARAGIAVVRGEAAGAAKDGEALRATLASWGDLPRRLAKLMRAETPTTVRTASASLLDAPWYRGSVVCIGACAHALPVQFGQAAAQAVEDAVVLGELVAAGLERAPLLERYMARRGERAGRVQVLLERAARWLAQPEPATDLVALSRELASIVTVPA
jgi:2-polyprenyl-6-methoxyphenol hydroxylase-like FAD-dependent oxidoreductase